MTTQPSGSVVATIRSLLPSLLPTERAVASVLLEHSSGIIEMSSQQVADLADASRATVVRTCQSLGFTGYQQLRVLLARDADRSIPSSTPDGAMGIVSESFRQLARGVDNMLALLDPASIEATTELLISARRVVVVGSGLSATLAMDTAARLTSVGRPAEAPLDVIGQQISARLLDKGDVLLAVSGSGANAATLRAVTAATDAGASVALVTAFGRSPMAQLATVTMVVTMPDLTFRDEIMLATRLPQAILLEGLVGAVAWRLGSTALEAKNLALDVIGENLGE